MVWRMGEGPLGSHLARARRRAWAIGGSPHRHPCSVLWDLAGQRRPAVPSLRKKLGVLREPNRLSHLARAQRHAHRLVELGPWAMYPISIRAASDRIQPDEEGRLCCCSWRMCYGSQTGSRVWLGPGGMLVGLGPWAAAPIDVRVTSDGIRPAEGGRPCRHSERRSGRRRRREKKKERKKGRCTTIGQH